MAAASRPTTRPALSHEGMQRPVRVQIMRTPESMDDAPFARRPDRATFSRRGAAVNPGLARIPFETSAWATQRLTTLKVTVFGFDRSRAAFVAVSVAR